MACLDVFSSLSSCVCGVVYDQYAVLVILATCVETNNDFCEKHDLSIGVGVSSGYNIDHKTRVSQWVECRCLGNVVVRDQVLSC